MWRFFVLSTEMHFGIIFAKTTLKLIKIIQKKIRYGKKIASNK